VRDVAMVVLANQFLANQPSSGLLIAICTPLPGFDEAKTRIEPPGGDVAERHREIELTRPMSCFSMSASAETAQ